MTDGGFRLFVPIKLAVLPVGVTDATLSFSSSSSSSYATFVLQEN